MNLLFLSAISSIHTLAENGINLIRSGAKVVDLIYLYLFGKEMDRHTS